MTIDEIKHYITENHAGTRIVEASGDFFFLYGADDRFPFATIVTHDNDFDSVSQLDREGVYRLNIGLDKESFDALFGNVEEKPGLGGYLHSGFDFTVLDTIMPHPTYGSARWVCVLSPGEKTLSAVKAYLEAAYHRIVERQEA